MVHAAQTWVAAGRTTCRSARPWALSRTRWALAYRRRRSKRLGRGCSPPPSTVGCAAVRLLMTGSALPRAPRLVNLLYRLLPLPRRRLLRRLPPWLSVKGIRRRQMGGSWPSRFVVRRSESGVSQGFRSRGFLIFFPLMRMMMKRRGGIGAVTVTPVRCSTGSARLACLMTLALLSLRLPGGGVPLRRERPMAASTGRTPGTRAPPLAGGRDRTSPRFLLRPRRPRAPAGGLESAGATS